MGTESKPSIVEQTPSIQTLSWYEDPARFGALTTRPNLEKVMRGRRDFAIPLAGLSDEIRQLREINQGQHRMICRLEQQCPGNRWLKPRQNRFAT